MTHSHRGAPAPRIIDPGEDREARALIERHLQWLRPRVRTASSRKDVDPPTVDKRKIRLYHAHRNLPRGIRRSAGAEIGAYLARWTGWSRYTYDTHLRGFYTWAVREGYLDMNPMADLPKPVPPGDDDILRWEDETIALAMTARAPYGTAIQLAAYMGLRCGEIARAHARDVRGDRLRVLGKGGRSRTVPIPPQITDLVHAATGPLLGRQTHEQALAWGQRKAWRAVGLPDAFSLHAGRHWYATRLLETGATVREVQRLLGHASIATTMRYLAVADGRLSDAVTRLPSIEHQPAGTRLVPVHAA